MIAATDQWDSPAREWTTDDLDALPEDGIRRELIDGVLIVSPAPSTAHQTLAMMLGATMATSCPEDFVVSQGVEVRINAKRTFIPDIVVVGASAAAKHPRFYHPQDVILVGEIVSPSSERFDRMFKPNLYAEVGIAYYWRIELEPGPSIYTYKCGTHGYHESGTYTDRLAVDEPWPMSFELASLLPKALRKQG